MKNPWKYALVAMLALAMLFSFTACDDDDDDDKNEEAPLDLSDTEVVNIIAAAFVYALTDGLETDDDGNMTATYSTWVQDSDSTTDEEGNTIYSDTYGNLTIATASEYTGYVESDEEGNGYTVVIKSGSSVYVPLGDIMYRSDDDAEVYYLEVVVDINATIDGVSEKLALSAYLDDSLSVLGSEDIYEGVDVDFTPSLTINGNAADMDEEDISGIVSDLIWDVIGAMYS